MMNMDLLKGEQVRLVAIDTQTFGKAMNRWARDSEYWRLMDGAPVRMFSAKKIETWVKNELDAESNDFFVFMIRTLQDDRLIGELGLDGVQWNHGDAFVGISLGERQDWGKGFGTDAMRVLLQYAFTELNLKRVSLTVFEYNQRAVRSYEKVGFSYEGRYKKYLNRAGKRWDLIFMGILCEEWQERYRRSKDYDHVGT